MRQCYICKKSYKTSNTLVMLRSHYNPTSSQRKKANLRSVKNLIPGKRVLVCMKCMRTLNKNKTASAKPAA